MIYLERETVFIWKVIEMAELIELYTNAETEAILPPCIEPFLPGHFSPTLVDRLLGTLRRKYCTAWVLLVIESLVATMPFDSK